MSYCEELIPKNATWAGIIKQEHGLEIRFYYSSVVPLHRADEKLVLASELPATLARRDLLEMIRDREFKAMDQVEVEIEVTGSNKEVKTEAEVRVNGFKAAHWLEGQTIFNHEGKLAKLAQKLKVSFRV